ncbi:hypothetical protein SNEBB_005736 [Seison nebaliae]|nr:hypothetical protein SNEBB_005736 [Seison nebaliae]
MDLNSTTDSNISTNTESSIDLNLSTNTESSIDPNSTTDANVTSSTTTPYIDPCEKGMFQIGRIGCCMTINEIVDNQIISIIVSGNEESWYNSTSNVSSIPPPSLDMINSSTSHYFHQSFVDGNFHKILMELYNGTTMVIQLTFDNTDSPSTFNWYNSTNLLDIKSYLAFSSYFELLKSNIMNTSELGIHESTQYGLVTFPFKYKQAVLYGVYETCTVEAHNDHQFCSNRTMPSLQYKNFERSGFQEASFTILRGIRYNTAHPNYMSSTRSISS